MRTRVAGCCVLSDDAFRVRMGSRDGEDDNAFTRDRVARAVFGGGDDSDNDRAAYGLQRQRRRRRQDATDVPIDARVSSDDESVAVYGMGGRGNDDASDDGRSHGHGRGHRRTRRRRTDGSFVSSDASVDRGGGRNNAGRAGDADDRTSPRGGGGAEAARALREFVRGGLTDTAADEDEEDAAHARRAAVAPPRRRDGLVAPPPRLQTVPMGMADVEAVRLVPLPGMEHLFPVASLQNGGGAHRGARGGGGGGDGGEEGSDEHASQVEEIGEAVGNGHEPAMAVAGNGEQPGARGPQGPPERAAVTGYCYLCATVPSDENVFRKWIQELVDRGSNMPLRQLCGLVLGAYTDYVKNAGPVPRPDWTLETIMEHMYDHQPTARFVLKQSVLTANALIKAHIRVAHRVGADGASVPCNGESRMIMYLMTGRAKLVQQYETACLASSTRK